MEHGSVRGSVRKEGAACACGAGGSGAAGSLGRQYAGWGCGKSWAAVRRVGCGTMGRTLGEDAVADNEDGEKPHGIHPRPPNTEAQYQLGNQ